MRVLVVCCLVALAVASAVVLSQATAQAARGKGVVEYRLLDDEPEGAFDLKAGVRAAGDGEARLCFGYRNAEDHYYLRLEARSLALVRVQGGKERELGRSEIRPALGLDPTPVIIKRRPEKIGVICRNALLLVVGDASPLGGKAGSACLGKMDVEDPRVQPVEPAAMSDDFMRKEGEPGPWETVSGQWALATVGDVKKSANGFSYAGTGTPAIAAAGSPYWDDYVLQASFKCREQEGAVGLCLYYQDPRNYLALEWGSKAGLRLLKKVDGDEKVLSEKPVAWIPDQWYRLSVQDLDGILTACVDGTPCLEARDPAFGRGKVALLAQGNGVHFDDVAVKPAVTFHDADPTAHPERWIEAGTARVIGCRAWEDYTYRARVQPQDGGGLAFLFGWRGPRDYCVFRWGGPGGRRRLVRVTDKGEEVLADAPGGYETGRAQDVQITFRPGYAAVVLNGEPALETGDIPLDAAGAVGVGTLSPAVRDIAVTLREPPPPPEEEITEEFANSAVHPDMAEWANPAKAWIPKQTPAGTLYWRKGEQYGDTWVTFPLPPLADGQVITVALGADGKDLASGYTLALHRPLPDRVTVHLQRAGASVRAVTVNAGSKDAVPVCLSWQGGQVLADVNGRRVLEYQDPQPLAGSRVGLKVDNMALDLKSVRVATLNSYDYTFHEAPTDWHTQSGVWEVTNRWSCQPGWSWFGGKSEQVAAIWNKRHFTGDLVFEYYAAPKMDAVSEAYERRFRDLNATICGDGKRLNSGYSFVLGGITSPRTLILRGDKIVAETTGFVLPTRDTGHHAWFYVRIEKRGSRISLSVDDRELLAYDDPDPLTGDRVALWTQNNGMLLARTVVSFQNEREMTLLARATGQAYVRDDPPAVPGGEKPERIAGAATGPATNPPPPAKPRLTAPPARPERPAAWERVAFVDTFAGKKPQARWATAVASGKWAVADGHFAPTDNPGYACVLAAEPVMQDCQVTADLLNGRDAGILVRAKDWDNCVLLVVRPAQKDVWWFVRQKGEWGPLYSTANLEFEQKPRVQVKVTAIGDTYTCYIDGREVSRLQDATFPVGRVGLYVNTALEGQSWANIEVRMNEPDKAALALAPGLPTAPPPVAPTTPAGPEQPNALLADAFEGGKTRIQWGPAEGAWKVDGKGHFRPTEKPEYAYAIAGEAGWRDYDIRAELLNGQDAGILLRAQDWDNCVFVVFRLARKELWWFVRRQGQWGAILQPTPLEIGVQPALKVRVTAVGDTFTCYLDGKQVSQLKDATYAQGKVGLYIHPAEAGQSWDNLEVLPAEPAKP